MKNGIFEPRQSDWSSLCILVDKPDGSIKFGADYRKVVSITKTDSQLTPRMNDCIDRIENAKYITKCFFFVKWLLGCVLNRKCKGNSCLSIFGRFLSVSCNALWNKEFPSLIPKTHKPVLEIYQE